jgi:hypothetical protein
LRLDAVAGAQVFHGALPIAPKGRASKA